MAYPDLKTRLSNIVKEKVGEKHEEVRVTLPADAEEKIEKLISKETQNGVEFFGFIRGVCEPAEHDSGSKIIHISGLVVPQFVSDSRFFLVLEMRTNASVLPKVLSSSDQHSRLPFHHTEFD